MYIRTSSTADFNHDDDDIMEILAPRVLVDDTIQPLLEPDS